MVQYEFGPIVLKTLGARVRGINLQSGAARVYRGTNGRASVNKLSLFTSGVHEHSAKQRRSAFSGTMTEIDSQLVRLYLNSGAPLFKYSLGDNYKCMRHKTILRDPS